MRSLIYLEYRQLVNSLKNTVRSPKRLIPSLIFVAWVVSWLIHSILLLSTEPQIITPSDELLTYLPIDTIRLIIFIALCIGSVFVVYSAFNSSLLVFSIAQIDFLFPTPISRRKVLLIKLLKDYLKYGLWVILIYFVVCTSVLHGIRRSLIPWSLVSITSIVALLIFIVNIAHTINIVFTFGYERLRQVGILIKVMLLGLPAGTLGYGIYHYAITRDIYAGLLFAANSPIADALFAPARWCSELFLAPIIGVTPEEWSHFAMLWLLAAGSLSVLLTRKENIYEPSLGISIKLARRRQMKGSQTYMDMRIDALREKGTTRACRFAVPPFGTGATALLWKNLVLKYRAYQGQVIFIFLLSLVIAYLIRQLLPQDLGLAEYVPLLMIYVIWLLSIAAQAEIKAELKFANIVKSMPIAAWKIMLAQIAGPVIYSSSAVLMFSGFLWALVPESRGDLLIACTLLAPFVGFANISAAIIPGLLYPDTKDFAQNYISGMLGFVLTTLAILPTGVLGVCFIVLFKASIYITVAVIGAANLIIGVIGISIAGAIFRKFEPTND